MCISPSEIMSSQAVKLEWCSGSNLPELADSSNICDTARQSHVRFSVQSARDNDRAVATSADAATESECEPSYITVLGLHGHFLYARAAFHNHGWNPSLSRVVVPHISSLLKGAHWYGPHSASCTGTLLVDLLVVWDSVASRCRPGPSRRARTGWSAPSAARRVPARPRRERAR